MILITINKIITPRYKYPNISEIILKYCAITTIGTNRNISNNLLILFIDNRKSKYKYLENIASLL